MSTIVSGSISGAGVLNSVEIIPGGSDNVAALLLSGSYTGFSGIVETANGGGYNAILAGILENTYSPDSHFIKPPDNESRTWLFNIVVGALSKIRLRPLAYGAGLVSVGWATGIVAGGWPVNLPGAIADASKAGSAANSQLVLTMPAVANKTNYVTGISVGGNGATASLLTIATLAGGYQGSLKFPFFVPAGVNTPLGQFAVEVNFERPIPASQPNLAVTLTVPAFGSGNNLATASLRGYTQ